VLDFAVVLVGSLLHVLALPTEWFPDGLAFLGPLALGPVFWFTARRGPIASALGGALWILPVTLLSQSWLGAFHPLALTLVLVFQLPWYAGAFALSSAVGRRWPAGGPWTQALLWTLFEALRIQGFFAFPYGSLASTVWTWPLVWQSADLVGTSGITFLLAWTAAWIGRGLALRPTLRRWRTDLAVGLGLWALDLGYGALRLGAPETGRPWTALLVQHAQDPWADGPGAYDGALDRLIDLSQGGLAPRPDAVVWSETAVVPSVDFHTRYHENPDSLRLVRRLEAFLATTDVPFVIGNGHREKGADGHLENYNAVLAWDGGWKGRYEKSRLVPFTEAFPFKEAFPQVYRWLLDADTHFWEPGRLRGPLTVGGVRIGTPVCYEDTFPSGAGDLARAGAQVLVNLTNDSWAPGVASRNQHLALAVFRTVETGLPLVRAGNDGATVAVSARGVVLARLPVGAPGVLRATVRLGSGVPTPYSGSGDWFLWAGALVLGGCMVFGPGRGPVVDKGPQL